MSMKYNQSYRVRQAFLKLLQDGETNKLRIYDKAVEITGVPRPTVRRVASTFRIEMKRNLEIFSGDENV